MKLMLALLAAFFLPSSAADPELRVYLPKGVRAQDTKISYFQVGPFGGGSADSRYSPQHHAYIVPLVLQQKHATNSKGILYMRGCALFTWDVSLKQSDIELRPACEPRPALRTRGRLKSSLEGEVTVFYMAPWAHNFFGIKDGMVVQMKVYTTSVNDEGEFDLELPNLFNDPAIHRWKGDWSDGYFWTHLRGKRPGNIIGELVPPDDSATLDGLKVLPSYPPLIEFTLKQR